MTESAIDHWSWRRKLVFGLIPGVVFFAALELGLRAFEIPREKYRLHRFAFPPRNLMGVAFAPDPRRFWRLVPGYDGPWTLHRTTWVHERETGVPFDPEAREAELRERDGREPVRWQVDERGWRGPLPRPGHRVVLFAGSSVTFGWGVPAEDAFPGIVGRWLRERAAEPWDAVNAGVPGYSSHQARIVVEELAPELPLGAVVFEAGANDGTFAPVRSDREFSRLQGTAAGGTAVWRHSNFALWLYYGFLGRRFRERESLANPFYATRSYRPGRSRVSPAEFVENLSAVRALAAERGAAVYFYFAGFYNDYGAGRITASVDHHEPEEIPVVAALAVLGPQERARQYLPWDEAHLSREGHARVAALVWERLVRDGVVHEKEP